MTWWGEMGTFLFGDVAVSVETTLPLREYGSICMIKTQVLTSRQLTGKLSSHILSSAMIPCSYLVMKLVRDLENLLRGAECRPPSLPLWKKTLPLVL